MFLAAPRRGPSAPPPQVGDGDPWLQVEPRIVTQAAAEFISMTIQHPVGSLGRAIFQNSLDDYVEGSF